MLLRIVSAGSYCSV